MKGTEHLSELRKSAQTCTCCCFFTGMGFQTVQPLCGHACQQDSNTKHREPTAAGCHLVSLCLFLLMQSVLCQNTACHLQAIEVHSICACGGSLTNCISAVYAHGPSPGASHLQGVILLVLLSCRQRVICCTLVPWFRNP